MLRLVIGNKNYSSWSMRPWVLLTQFGIPFEEIMLKFGSTDWEENIARLSPSRMVPVLWNADPQHPDASPIWDTLAIIETLAEMYPDKAIWPRQHGARALARSMVAEMHAGFRALRSSMPMNIRASHPGLGMNADVANNIARIESLWRQAREQYGAAGPYLFGEFCAADAMYAPVVMRFKTYQPAIAKDTAAYCETIQNAAGVAAWIREALQETEWVAEDEPYATPPAA
ncbi:MAG: glutathione S-transferase family protein [Betaproteobacteria bacterium]|nr:glutathione S-transferase family protein [Betaproteobacteria bacterium]